MTRIAPGIIVPVALALVGASQVVGQSKGSAVPVANSPVSSARAVRLDGTVRVDGVLDEDGWRNAPAFGGFVQRDPDEGRAATHPTDFRVLYGDRALFIAVRAHDADPSGIRALLARRDDWSPADEITVMIDSYHDRRTGFSFSVNAAGVKRDAYLYNDWEQDSQWDAVWDVATRIDSLGWVAEFRIPWSQLRFSPGATHTFGFNVSRRIDRLNETQFWRVPPKNSPNFVSVFGDLAGIDGIEPRRRLEILPYTAASSEWHPAVAGNPFRTGRSRWATVGGDVKMGINSSLTLTATFNPDFGQVDADPAVVNLSAFESFFPERRPFFTEGIDLFRFRLSDGDGDNANEELFYTRRIGRVPTIAPDPQSGFAETIDRTTILGAGKLSGKTRSGWTLGLLGAVTAREDARVFDGLGQWHQELVEPRTGYAVARVARELRDGQTIVSFLGTAVERSLPTGADLLHSSAYSTGVAWQHRFAHDSYQLSGRIVGSRVEGSPQAILATQLSSARYFQRPDADYVEVDSNRTSLSGYGFGVNGGRTRGNWRWNVNVDARSPGFEVNDIGFMREADRMQQSVWINRRWLTPSKTFRRFNLNFNQWAGWSFGWDRRFVGGNINMNFTLLNYWYGYLGLNRNWRGSDPAGLRGGPALTRPGANNAWFGFGSDERKSLRIEFNGGGWRQDQSGSWETWTNAYLTWRPAGGIQLSAGPNLYRNHSMMQYLSTDVIAGRTEYLFGEIEQTTTSMTFRSNFTFSPSLTLQVYAQPFVSAGRYVSFRRVVSPKARRFADQVETFDGTRATRLADGDVALDYNGDGQSDLTLANPDFRVLSFRSNVVLRWEYQPGSTIFLVWQHGRGETTENGAFHLGEGVRDLFRAQATNVLLLKVNYWFGL